MDFSEKPAFSRSTYREISVHGKLAASPGSHRSSIRQAQLHKKIFNIQAFVISNVFSLWLSQKKMWIWFEIISKRTKKLMEVLRTCCTGSAKSAISALSENGMLPQKKLNNSTKMKKLQESHDDDLISMNSFSNLIAALMMDCYGQ
ncbi:unnamed protein product, partial [Mesorhabditis belari]|uniref:Uncharacterized protein n=1 Tax=Mesorhabditis belari TaxID=2138241 RepID=A0AAF3EA76_9BILA